MTEPPAPERIAVIWPQRPGPISAPSIATPRCKFFAAWIAIWLTGLAMLRSSSPREPASGSAVGTTGFSSIKGTSTPSTSSLSATAAKPTADARQVVFSECCTAAGRMIFHSFANSAMSGVRRLRFRQPWEYSSESIPRARRHGWTRSRRCGLKRRG